MTLQEALDLCDEMKPNMMSRKLKVKYLSEIEGLIHAEILMKHWHTPTEARRPEYTEDSDEGTVLIVPDPYSMVYVYWLMQKIDLMNQEDIRYNNDRMQFEQAYMTMGDWWNRTYRPWPQKRELRI